MSTIQPGYESPNNDLTRHTASLIERRKPPTALLYEVLRLSTAIKVKKRKRQRQKESDFGERKREEVKRRLPLLVLY